MNILSDMSGYIKKLIPPSIPLNYPIKPQFHGISNENDIRSSILSFRELLYTILDRLICDGESYEVQKKNPSSDTVSHPSLPVCCPFLNNIKSILFNIGFHGELANGNNSILLSDISILNSTIGVDGNQMKAKISKPKLLKSLRFLSSCGFIFHGIDLDNIKIDNSKTIPLSISYEKAPLALMGMKVMAIAQKNLYSKGNHDIFLRCDYRILVDDDIDISSVLKDFIFHLSQETQDFILGLHERYTSAGLTCRLDIFYLGVRFIYSRKSKEIFTFSGAQESGYRLLLKAQKTEFYRELIATFPHSLQKKISKGYGCNKKLFKETCQKGCHGFSFPLDDSLLDIKEYLVKWLDAEMSCNT